MDTERSKNLLADMPREQRYAALKEMAAKVGNEKVRRYYSEDEKSQIKNFVADESVKLMDTENDFAQVKKEFNAGIKVIKTELKDALGKIKRGYSEQEDDVFMLDDQEAGLMNVYDRDGIFLYSRKLHPEERQTRVISIAS